MPRPSKAAERTEQILDAFEACIMKHGLGGSSLENIAKEAGMKRSILRHYIGNREELELALFARVMKRYHNELDVIFDWFTDDDIEEQVLAMFFPNRMASSMETIVMTEALLTLSRRSEECEAQFVDYMNTFVAGLTEVLMRHYVGAGEDRCWSVSYGIISIYFNQDTLMTLQLPSRYVDAARETARILLRSLEQLTS